MKTLSVVLSLLSFLCFAPVQAQQYWKNSISGEGPVVKEELSLSEFQSLGLGISGTVYLTPGSTQKVVVEGQKNLIDNLKHEVKNGSWSIAYEQSVRGGKEMIFYITLPTVKTLAIGGSGKIISKEAFNDLGALKLSIGGSGTIEFAGSANSADISIGGSGGVKASNLKVQSCKVSIGGSGNCSIEVGESLDASIGGSGSVHYKGRPKVNTRIGGSGKVVTID